MTTQFNKETMQLDLTEDTTTPHKIKFLSKGEPYKLWGIFKSDFHFFAVPMDICTCLERIAWEGMFSPGPSTVSGHR